MIFEKQRIIRTAQIAGLVMCIPLLGNLFTSSWNWGVMDFVFAFVMLLGAGVAIDFTLRKLPNFTARIITVICIAILFIAVWAELAVDAVSKMLRFLI